MYPEDYRTDERRNYGGSLRLDLTARKCREAFRALRGVYIFLCQFFVFFLLACNSITSTSVLVRFKTSEIVGFTGCGRVVAANQHVQFS